MEHKVIHGNTSPSIEQSTFKRIRTQINELKISASLTHTQGSLKTNPLQVNQTAKPTLSALDYSHHHNHFPGAFREAPTTRGVKGVYSHYKTIKCKDSKLQAVDTSLTEQINRLDSPIVGKLNVRKRRPTADKIPAV